mmetsp:Transcript_23634/g.35149  ORF Transcript_23634/g.35149 Transcript_23634/m.35149 type:complete len:290 (-) Transcript_23634:109-978(-)
MLAADKLQLQSHVKQQATALKEKEFNLHHSNLMTVGTQAAVLAGLDITLFVEFTPAKDSEWLSDHEDHKAIILLIPRLLKFLYYITIVSAFCANILVVGQTTILSVLGASLALRGPDGSMNSATNGIYEERVLVFKTFGYGLFSTLLSVIFCVWLMCSFEASMICNIAVGVTIHFMIKHFKRIRKKFMYNEDETVDFTDLFNTGSGATPRRKNNPMKKERDRKRYYSPENDEEDDDDDDDDDDYRRTNVTRKRTPKYFGSQDSEYDYESENTPGRSKSEDERIGFMNVV